MIVTIIIPLTLILSFVFVAITIGLSVKTVGIRAK